MSSIAKAGRILLVTLACCSCSSQIDHERTTDGLSKQASTNTVSDLASLTTATGTMPSASTSENTEALGSTQQQYPEGDLCAMLDGCKKNFAPTETGIPTQTSQTTDNTRTGGAGTLNQTSIYPDMDVDLVQWPWESDVQYVNGIYTSVVPNKNNVALSQKSEFKNVKFNQFSAPSSINTVNAVITNDKSVNGSLEQSFKFKSIEMIQRDSSSSIHAMNYLGNSMK
jgi:hypothetical protein